MSDAAVFPGCTNSSLRGTDVTFLQSNQTRRPSGSLGPLNEGQMPGSADQDAWSDPSPSKRKVWLILLAAVLAVVVALGFAVQAIWRSLPAPHLTVEVFNDTGAPMTDVRFVLAGGRGVRSCKTIASGTTLAWEVTGQSDGFTLEYRQPDGRVVTRKCALAIDGDDWGNITLHVKHGGLKVLTEVDVPEDGSSR